MKKITLKHPVVDNGQEIKELNMRRPKVRDMVAADVGGSGKSDAAKEVTLFANLCGVTEEVIGDIDMADYAAVQEVYTSFLS